MIRINLLSVERERAKKSSTTSLLSGISGQKLTVGLALILVAAVAIIGWRYWALGQESRQLDVDIVAAQQESARLQSLIQQVTRFEAEKAQLQQRVNLIEQLRKSQTGPVHMLDQISRALPPMLWLTEVKQSANDVILIDGRCTAMTSLSDFIANLEASGYFKRSVEIVSTQTEASKELQAPEIVKFSIKGQFQRPGEPAPAAAGGAVKHGG